MGNKLLLFVSIFLSLSSESDNLIRLGESDKLCSGRIEIYHNGVWGTVCDDGWDLNDAEVACRQLGCGPALDAPGSAYFGQGTGQIWLDDLVCTGNETSLGMCEHSGFGTHNCVHGEDAGVICSNYSIRLVGSDKSCSGRIEIYHNGVWGTVCDDGWDLNDAEVACRQLGCGPALDASGSAHFGQGTGQIWLDDLVCSGSETSLGMCGHIGFGTHNCGHHEDAGVKCSNYSIRLVGSDTSCSGRIEIYHTGVWGTVCDDGWDLNDAEVACRELGCGRALGAPRYAHFGQGTGQIWLDDLVCSGSETSLGMCGHSGFGTHNCGHHEDAGVKCSNYSIRLVGSDTSCSGRIEIYHNGVWGTVCDDGWDLNDAEVACRELGCGRALGAPRSAHFGQGTGQIWLDDLVCSGSETSLGMCGHSGFGTHNCGHHEDAAVICSSYKVRLIGSSPCSGRVEIYYNYTWGTVCDDNWSIDDARVVCSQLGCGTAFAAPHSARFGQGTDKIWLDNVTCAGSERYLSECSHTGLGMNTCVHSQDASVICSDQIQPIVTVNPPGNIIWGQGVSIKCSIPDIQVTGTFVLKRSTDSFRQCVETGNGSATFYIAHVSFEDEGSFQCHFTVKVFNEEYSSLRSHTVWLNVSLPKPNISMDPAGAVIFGQLVAITCSIPIQALGGSFTLRKTIGSLNKTQLSNTNSSTFRFLEASNNNEGDYHCFYEKMGKYQNKTSPLSANVTIYLTDV